MAVVATSAAARRAKTKETVFIRWNGLKSRILLSFTRFAPGSRENRVLHTRADGRRSTLPRQPHRKPSPNPARWGCCSPASAGLLGARRAPPPGVSVCETRPAGHCQDMSPAPLFLAALLFLDPCPFSSGDCITQSSSLTRSKLSTLNVGNALGRFIRNG